MGPQILRPNEMHSQRAAAVVQKGGQSNGQSWPSSLPTRHKGNIQDTAVNDLVLWLTLFRLYTGNVLVLESRARAEGKQKGKDYG